MGTFIEQPGVSTFLELGDTPSSYAGAGGQAVQVNATPDGLEFVSASSSLTFYNDAVSGTIDGSNTSFTVPNTIDSAISLHLAGQPYQLTTDYSVSGTTVTMVVAPHESLAGQPFWLSHT